MEAGLVNLRAILNKKRQEASQSVVERDAARFSAILKVKDQEGSFKKKEKVVKVEDSCDQEAEQKFAKSKSMLERKAALYDKLKSGTEVLEHDELNEKFLVNFQEKIIKDVKAHKDEADQHQKGGSTSGKKKEEGGPKEEDAYAAKKEEDEWVEYTDSLGRTRMCQKKDLDAMRELDSQILGFDVKKANLTEETSKEFHERWNKIEEETKLKDDIHYQDVLFDEARVHGVGYMHFSRDEEVRKKQQQLLKEIRKETLEAERTKTASQRKRDVMMSERLAKVRQKKRLKMGLPAISLEEKKLQEEPSLKLEEEPPKEPETHQASTSQISPGAPIGQKDTPPPIREWDIGKYSSTGTVMTQQQWVQSKRKDRNEEFAPPSFYDASRSDNGTRSKSSAKRGGGGPNDSRNPCPQGSFFESLPNSYSKEACFDSKGTTFGAGGADRQNSAGTSRGAGPEFAPPSTFEYYGPTPKRGPGHLKTLNVEDSIEKGLAYFRRINS